MSIHPISLRVLVLVTLLPGYYGMPRVDLPLDYLEGVGGELADGSLADGRGPTVDELLETSMLTFHREGPLVNPLETQGHAIAGWHTINANACMKDRMRFVCEAGGALRPSTR
jgi:hypothetical protein